MEESVQMDLEESVKRDPSEQCAYDGSLDPDDSSSGTERTGLQIVTRCEDFTRILNQGDGYTLNIPLNQCEDANEQVLGYLDQENQTIVLQSQGIELDGKRLILTQDTGGEEIILLVSSDQDPSVEHSFEESVSGNSPDNHTLAIECGSNNLRASKGEEVQEIEVIETNDGLQRIDKNETVYVQQAHELAYVDSDNNHYSSEDLGNALYHIQDKDDTTEMVFIPTTSQVISTSNNTRLLHLADVAHSEWATTELHEKEESDYTKKSELSVIVNQTRAESDSHSIKLEDSTIIVVNEQKNTNSLHDEPMAAEFAMTSPAVEGNSPSSVAPRDIDNAVSVIHITSSTLIQDQDWRTKNIQEDDIQTENICQSETELAVKSTNVSDLAQSDLKETLDSELSPQSAVLEESSNNSHIKDYSDTSNKDDNVSYETPVIVEEPMEEDTDESINFSSQLPSGENIDQDDSKQNDIICKDNDSSTSIDIDQSQNLDNKISDSSSRNCVNEMDFTNSEEACSEAYTSPEKTFLSLKDNSEFKSSFFSDNSQTKDLNLQKFKKLKSDTPNKIKKAVDEYEFENSSSNLDKELSHNSSPVDKCVDIEHSDDISAEVDVIKVSQSGSSDTDALTGNLTFQGALTPPVSDSTKVNENLVNDKNEEIEENSQDLFDQCSQDDKENSSGKILNATNANLVKNKENFVSNEINHTDQDKSSDGKIGEEKSVNIDSDSVDSKIVSSVETTVKPPQRTYVRKRKISDRNIELFSLDDLSDPKDEAPLYLTPKIFSPDKQKDQTLNDENNLTDEDGYVNLMPSDINNIIKTKSTTSPMDERKTRSLRPRSSDHLVKAIDPVVDAEDSVSACWGAYLMEASFKPTNTETIEDVTKASPENIPKAESPKSPKKKRVRTPSNKKISAEANSSKSGQQWDKLIKSSPTKMKHASSEKRKVREKVKKQVKKKLKNSENINNSQIIGPQSKKAWLNKNGEKSKTFFQFNSLIPERVKTCGIRFLNNNSTEKNNSAIDEFSTASTSTQELKNFQYTCSNCSNFVSNKVNNLIIHLKYCAIKPSADIIDYRVNDMDRRLRIRGDFTESDPLEGNNSTSQNFSGSSVIDNDEDEQDCLSPSEGGLHHENGEENLKEDDYDNQEEQNQNSIANEKTIEYSENQIVWARVNNRFWPALVHKIDETKLEIYLIDYPTKTSPGVSNVHMNVSIELLSYLLHSYNDVNWQKDLLAEAENLPDNDLFFKAVQKSDSYTRKRFLYNKGLDGRSFFNIDKSVELVTVMKDDDDDTTDEDDEQFVDIKELMECIFHKKCDKHVIGIYNGVVESERHTLHHNKDKEAASRLKNMSWFGPFKNNSQMQIKLHDYFIDLFKSKFGTRKDLISYIYEVWIPEGIIKAISIVKHISLLEAQIIFYKQDMTSLDIEDFELDCEDL